MAQYSIGEAISKMLNESHWKYRYQVTKLKEDWELLMGVTIAKHTKDLTLHNGVLYIQTDVAALKHELSYNKQLLVSKINQHFDENLVQSIVVK
jgi:predicted nucleic acid-binding Zn ribbon protein